MHRIKQHLLLSLIAFLCATPAWSHPGHETASSAFHALLHSEHLGIILSVLMLYILARALGWFKH